MKRLSLLLCLLACCCALSVMAQSTEQSFTFLLKDKETKKSISNVVCQAYVDEQRMTAYGISNQQGEVTIKVRSKVSHFTFSLLGYKKVRLSLQEVSARQPYTLYLEASVEALKGIIVKAPPIVRRKDTLVYNVSTIANEQDKSIGDVIRKLPGIEVSETGKISYQGRPISHFYIEGQDLLGGSYNQATENIPYQAVSQVHVMEQHQHQRVLKDKVLSDQAAMNIKLKDGYRVRIFGEAMVGAGGTPLIADGKLFLMQVGKKQQWMLNAKGNNRGANLSSEIEEHVLSADMEVHEALPSAILSTSRSNMLSLPLPRYLFNRSTVWGLHGITKVNDMASWRINLTGYADRSTEEKHSAYVYGGATPFSLYEQAQNKVKSTVLKPTVLYELNSPKLYLSNEFKASIDRRSKQSELLSNSTALDQRAVSRPRFIQNRVSGSVGSGRKVWRFNAFGRYYRGKELLDLEDALLSSAFTYADTYKNSSLLLKAGTGNVWNFGRNSLSVSLEGSFEENKYRADSIAQGSEAMYRRSQISIAPAYRYSFQKDARLSVSVPVDYYVVTLATQQSQERRYWTVSPSIGFKKEVNVYWKWNASLGWRKAPDDESVYAADVIRKGYRLYYAPLSQIYTRETWRVAGSINYQNVAKIFFLDIFFAANWSKRHYLRNYSYEPQRTVTTVIDTTHHNRNIYGNVSMSKGLTDTGLSLNWKVGYTHTHQLLAQYARRFENTSHILFSTFGATYQKIKWLRLNYSITGNRSWQENDVYQIDPYYSLHQEVKWYTPLMKGRFNISAHYQHSILQVNSLRKYKHLHFADVELIYKPTSRVRLSLGLYNLFDNDTYSLSSANGINTEYIEVPLRPRQGIVTVQFSL